MGDCQNSSLSHLSNIHSRTVAVEAEEVDEDEEAMFSEYERTER